jgi:Mrp family chromosome partitioning ATPase
LVDVLNAKVGMSAATYTVEPRSATDLQTLSVLPSGSSLPPNSVELIESNTMKSVLAQAKSTYDLVVIDSPEFGVSDAFLLSSKVDGVVIVGRVGQCRRSAASHLRQVLETSEAPVVGVIANCFASRRRISRSARRATAREASLSSKTAEHSRDDEVRV